MPGRLVACAINPERNGCGGDPQQLGVWEGRGEPRGDVGEDCGIQGQFDTLVVKCQVV